MTLVHRQAQMHPHVKYWVRPDIENRIKAGEIKAHFDSTVREIGRGLCGGGDGFWNAAAEE